MAKKQKPIQIRVPKYAFARKEPALEPLPKFDWSREKEPRHCDTYVHDHKMPMCLRWWVFINRLPAIDKCLCRENNIDPILFADYQGIRVRVTMASRFGD